MYNKVILIGRLTRDVELKFLATGTPIATVSLAVNSRFAKDKEEVLFIDCSVFGKPAEACAQYITKGSMVMVDGRLKTRSWEYEGKKQHKTEVMADKVAFLDKRGESGRPSEQTQHYSPDPVDPF